MKSASRLLALALTLLPMLAVAQLGVNDKIVAHVPFDFKVADQSIPAGDCTLQTALPGSWNLLIRNSATMTRVIAQSMAEPSRWNAEGYSLVFHKYGNLYFLTAIKHGKNAIHELPRSSAEAELQAQNQAASEEVLVASLH